MSCPHLSFDPDDCWDCFRPATEPRPEAGINWPKPWTADDIAWVKRQILAEAAQGAAPFCPCDEYEPCAEHQSKGAAPLTCQRCGHHEGCSTRCCMNQAEPCDLRAAPRLSRPPGEPS